MAPLSVLGELFLTAGAVVLLYLAWHLWWNDDAMAASQSTAATELSREWATDGGTSAGDGATATGEQPGERNPVVAAAPRAGEPLGVLYVPRFGADYRRTIAEGVGRNVLNSTRLGVGHYPGTQMPGELGNFAVAAHRSAFGGAFHDIDRLQDGDPIYVQTAAGYYTYLFSSHDVVSPSTVEVIAPVPGSPGETPTDRMITLTSCHPLYSTAERIVAHGVLESWRPAAAGPPEGLARLMAGDSAGTR
jgi:sortase A